VGVKIQEEFMRARFLILAGFLVVCLAAPRRLQGQAIGEILGTVRDPTGAVVPKARITAVQTATGLSRSTISGAEGTYTLPQLPVGAYDVTAEVSGFKSATTRGITLDVSQQREVNFTLTLAGAQQQVEVTATSPLLTTTNGSLGGLVTGEQVQTLPLNGREITNLVMLQPGMNHETDSTGWLAPEWAGNGNRGQTEVAMLDNIDTTDAEMGNVQFWNFNLDAIAEFKVLQNNYSAEYGQGGGTVVQMVSKTGTNQIHGSAFEFIRNSALNVRNFFSDKVPPFQRNEFGGTFGGPIKKDKTFYFLEYAGFRQRLGEPTLFSVPTAEERQGIVTIPGPGGQTQTLTVPLNPIAQDILNRYPAPNQPGGVFGPRTYNVQFKLPRNNDQFSVRGDHTFSAKDSIFIRASYINNKVRSTDAVAASENPLFSSSQFNNPRNYALTENHIFSPTLLNTFSFGINREVTGVVPGTQAYPQNTFTDGSLANFGPDTFITKYVITQFIPQDKVSWTKGRHSIAFGGQFRRLWDNAFGVSVGGPNGIYQFNPGTPLNVAIPIAGGGTLPVGTPSPNSLVSFMVGQPGAYTRTTGMQGFSAPGSPSPYGVRVWHLNAFAQDDIKVTSRLTVNLGLRYEYNSVPTEAANRLDAIVDDPKFGGGTLFRHMILNPSRLYNPDYRSFGPRFGIAERVSNRTVLRGGFGVFTNVPPTVFPDQALVNFPYASFTSQTNPPFSATPLPVTGVPVLLSLSGQPMPPNNDTHKIPVNTPVNLEPIAAFFGGGNPANGRLLTNLTSFSYRNGYTMAGNVTLEQQLPGSIALQFSYAMNNAVGLYSSEWPNGYTGALPQYTPFTAVDPGIGEFQFTDNHAHSTYNGLQVQLRTATPQHGLQFQVAYTYSKTIDNASTVWNGNSNSNSGTLPNNPLCYACEKSRSGFDFPQRLVANFGYQLPFDHWVSSAPRRLTEGWQVLSIISAQSGFPFTVNSPYGTSEFGIDTYTGFQPTRPDLAAPATLSTAGGPQFFSDSVLSGGQSLSQQVFVTPGCPAPSVAPCTVQSRPGALGRNTFRTHSFSNVDLSLVKDTRITEDKTLQFRAEFFNLFNQHAFETPGQVLGTGSFGVASATVLPERQIQFGLRFIF
jgi:hypothetical protein